MKYRRTVEFASVVLMAAGCSGGVQTTCGTVTDADGGVVEIPCGGTGSGGDTSTAGENGVINFAGASSTLGGASSGGASATGGSATGGTTPAGSRPYIVYKGASAKSGTAVTCGVWVGADTSNASDPLNQLPGYGIYDACNPTSAAVKDFWLRFAVQPFYPTGNETYKYAFNYFFNAQLILSNLEVGKTIGVRLDGATAYTAYPGEGTVWMNFKSGDVPAFVIPANSCVQFEVRATLCPYVKVIPQPGELEHICPNTSGSSVSLRVGSHMFGNDPTGEIGSAWGSNVFGGTCY